MADTSSNDQAPANALEAAVSGDGAPAPAESAGGLGLSSIVDDVATAAAAAAEQPDDELMHPTAPTTGTATPFEMDPEQRSNSLKVSLADLCARATALYAHRSYEDAAEVFAQAAEMQAEMNGEMSPENAEILFLYGRALFRVGQGKSDVLGGKAPEGKQAEKKGAGKKANGAAAKPSTSAATEAEDEKTEEDRVAEEAVKIIADETSGTKKEDTELEAKKPLFQFTGDENFDDSDEEEAGEGEEEGEGEDEEDDDLAMAFEILDLARVLFGKRLEMASGTESDDKGKEKETTEDSHTPTVKHIKERLADTHDLLAEISLENERYPNAMTDFRQSLKLKEELHPEESEVIAEAHYKLSLAMEFASVTISAEETGDAGPKPVDQSLRDDAAAELEAAIRSTKLKLANKEVDLATLHSPEDNENTRKQIAEVKEIIADMEQRLADLRKPPVDLNAAVFGATGASASGVLGAALGESSGQAQARIEEAKKNAKDLTNLVRKKNRDEPAKDTPTPPPSGAHAGTGATNGHDANGTAKRKPEAEPADGEEQAASKKVRLEDAAEA